MKKENVGEEFARYEERYRDLGKRLVDSIWVIDPNTLKVLYVSSTAEDICGYGMEDIIGRYLREVSTEDSYQMALVELEKARREYEGGGDAAARLELECYSRHSTTTWVEIVARFVEEEDEPVRIVGVSRDISDRKFDEMNKRHLYKMYMETLAEETRLRSDVRLLEKLLPICGGCRQIRDDENRWRTLEAHVLEKTEGWAAGILCPECEKVPGHRK